MELPEHPVELWRREPWSAPRWVIGIVVALLGGGGDPGLEQRFAVAVSRNGLTIEDPALQDSGPARGRPRGRRFVAWADVAAIEPAPGGGITVHRCDGTTCRLSTGHFDPDDMRWPDDQQRKVAQLREAWRAATAAG